VSAAPEPRSEDEDARSSAEETPRRGSVRLYLVAFALVVLSFAAMALGGLSLLGRGVDVSPTGLFWSSIVLSVLALATGVGALFIPRPPR
jgi:hypothetical protein